MKKQRFKLTDQVKCFTANHRGGLKECLETEKPITKEMCLRLINCGAYDFYAYDERIKADRYLIKNMEENQGLPEWINVYKEK